MNFWQNLSVIEPPFVVVKVEKTNGSTPRASDAKMVITHDDVLGTIGGGNMEYQAISLAQNLLKSSQDKIVDWQTFPLIPRFDQCCGGRVQLSFEKVTQQTLWFQKLKNLSLNDFKDYVLIHQNNNIPRTLITLEDFNKNRFVHNSTAQNQFFEPLIPVQPKIIILGAGHVARSLIHHLTPLELDISCYDTRACELNKIKQPNVKKKLFDDAQSMMNAVPNHSYCLIMTHSHRLDFELTKSCLVRAGLLKFIGLIGSKAKKHRFVQQLINLGISKEEISKLECPVGTPNIQGKTPELIALSITYQLLEKLQQDSLRPKDFKEPYYVSELSV